MENIGIIAQLIGCVGFVLNIFAFQCKKHKGIMLFKTGSELVLTVQYLLLGAYTGAAMNLVGCFRSTIFAMQVEKNRSTRLSRVIFCVFFIVFGLLTWDGPISIFAILGKAGSTIAYGMKKSSIVRLLTLPTCIFWLIYNVHCRSLAGVLSDAFSLISIVVAMIRLDLPEHRRERLKKNDPDSQ